LFGGKRPINRKDYDLLSDYRYNSPFGSIPKIHPSQAIPERILTLGGTGRSQSPTLFGGNCDGISIFRASKSFNIEDQIERFVLGFKEFNKATCVQVPKPPIWIVDCNFHFSNF
jgi:hypothetical protein